jgi:hypothetical protein
MDLCGSWLVRSPRINLCNISTNEYPTMAIPAKTNKAAKIAALMRFSAF